MAEAGLTWEGAVRWLLAQPGREDLVRDCYFDAPLTSAWTRYAEGVEWAEARRLVGPPPPGGRALDVGAGNGVVAAALARDGWTSVAVEPDPSDLVGAGAIRAGAAAAGLAIDVRGGTGEALPLPDADVDLIVTRQTLHHAADLPAFARELRRVLKPGGALLTIRDHVAETPAELAAFLARHPLHHLYGGEHAFPLQAYRDALTRAGFAIEAEFGPFDSVLNTAPLTLDALPEKAAERVARLPAIGPLAAPIIRALPAGATRALLKALVREPGRLHSFLGRAT